MQIPKKLLPFMQKPKRFKIMLGGRGSAKSMTIADLLLMRAQMEGVKIGCFREFMNSIDDSVHALLKGEIERLGLQGFETLNTAIRHDNGAEFKFKGMARNPEGIKSAHDFKYFFVEEAQTISSESLKNLTPTLRTEGSEIWMAANLRSMADPFSQRFFKPFEKQLRQTGYYEDDLHLIVWINYNDNPLFPEVLEQERKYDLENLSTAMYRHIWLGECYDEVLDSIIPVEWFEASIDAHIKLGFKPTGAIIASHDPSDTGPDPKGFCVRHGSVFLDIVEERVGDVNDGIDWALDRAEAANADWFVWDGDGLGAPLKRDVDKFCSGKKLDYFMFKGSEGVEDPEQEFVSVEGGGRANRKTNKDSLMNKRAQYAHKMMMRFYNTWRAVTKGDYIDPDELISISSDIKNIDEIRAQFCRVPRKRNNNGKFQVMTKLEMSKKPYELPSPNMFDSAMMSMYAPAVKRQANKITFEGW